MQNGVTDEQGAHKDSLQFIKQPCESVITRDVSNIQLLTITL